MLGMRMRMDGNVHPVSIRIANTLPHDSFRLGGIPLMLSERVNLLLHVANVLEAYRSTRIPSCMRCPSSISGA
jgi:hypothetical protein